MDRLIFITRSLRSHELEHQPRSTSTMSTETRREIYHTTMEMSEPISTCYRLITEEQKPVMATVEIAYEEGHKDGYQEGWQNCNRELHDVVAQESYDDGIRQGRAMAADEIAALRKKIEEQQAEIKLMNELCERELERSAQRRRDILNSHFGRTIV